jgi:hypothetical protein
MRIKIFDGIRDFYNFINDHEITDMTPTFGPFITAYDAISVGCGCTRKARVQVAVDRYRDIVSLLQVDTDILEKIKIQGQFSEIQIYQDGTLFFKG